MSKHPKFTLCLAFAAVVALGAPAVFAMNSDDDSKPSQSSAANPDYAAGKAAVEAKDWKSAIASLTKAEAKDPKNADLENYLGYAYRNAGDMDAALKHYGMALTINPDHKGAHEYMGEAYLLKGDLADAQKHLDALDKICLLGCAEYTVLKQKVAAYKKANKTS
ncbi:MAG TPA: tetratricopeptide repeat protein [Candidatus Sulfotelmatobacter sp.]|nr:tetratricopeptide repeat protein [Candidatus Sulfotelmatobacter sp.]